MDVYPLVFEPIFKRKIWGGSRLAKLLGKRLPQEGPIGESWEVADLEDDQSIVANGPARGKTLGDMVKVWGTELIGRAPLVEGRFPLLIKYLDAHDTLSVQVHPDEAMARKLGGRVRVKNEAWYVIDAEKGGFIYRGVRDGVDADALKRAVDEQKVESVLNRIDVRKDHCYYLPSGTIHALGAGVLVAEVQSPSDVTYRIYDWNRVDPSTGSPRELHLDHALECTSYDTGPIAEESVHHVASVWTTVTRLVRCESFAIDRVRLAEGVDQEIPSGEFLIWMVLQGRGTVTHTGTSQDPVEPVSFGVGDTLLIPAGLSQARVQAHDDCMWLEVAYPIASPLAAFDRPDSETLKRATSSSGGFAQLNVREDRSDQQ
ncbi:MAG: type I phosphomannose isomerase catalytic subunit [Planctomycetota bacterium]|jgi:mannose-6-phosphate isomerase